MFSPAGTRRCRPGRFRFIPSHMCCQAYIPDCHLVRTAIPCLPSYDSLGDFHSRENRSLSLFCKHGFQKRCRHPLWPQRTAAWSSFPTCSLKAGYAARSTRFCAPPCRFIPDSYAIGPLPGLYPSSHKVQVSTETGSYAPCHWSAPWILNPQHPPKTGRNKQTPGTSSMCPSKDF